MGRDKVGLKRFFAACMVLLLVPGWNVKGTEGLGGAPLPPGAAQVENQGYTVEVQREDAHREIHRTDLSGILLQEGALTVSTAGPTPVEDTPLEKHLHGRLMAMETSIDVRAYKLTSTQAFDTYRRVMNQRPDLFHVGGNVSLRLENGLVTTVLPAYKYSAAVTATMQQVFQAEVGKILALVKPGMSVLEQALVLQDHMAANVAYDYDNYLKGTIPASSYDAYGTLVKRQAVCQGYALAYLHILRNELRIPVEYVVSPAMNHAWNMVAIDGDYYHVDVTWNDPVRDVLGRAGHRYFLLSDGAIASLSHHGWAAAVTATNPRFDNAFWTYVDNPFARILDKYYYVNSSRDLMEADFEAGTQRKVRSLEAPWPISGNSYYMGPFSNLHAVRGMLYFNWPDGIYAVHPDGTGLQRVYATDSVQGRPYGFAYRDGKFQYVLSNSPNMEGTEPLRTASIPLGPGVSGISLDTGSFEMEVGASRTVKATVLPENAMNKRVAWVSTNPQVATVTGGVIQGMKAGSAVIRAVTLDGDKTASITVTVKEKGVGTPALTVLSGSNRFTTAVEISKSLHAKADKAILVLGADFPDALAAGPLAVKLGAPILLTQTTRLPDATLGELKRLGVGEVVLLGGDAVIGKNVENALRANGIQSIQRIAGSNRYDTAAKVADALAGASRQQRVVLASGTGFADALAAGSYAGKEGLPILLTRQDRLVPQAKDALLRLQVAEVLILGGTAAIDAKVEQEIKNMGIKVERSFGSNRFLTAVDMAERFFPKAEAAVVANGLSFADALAAAPFAAKHGMPILLVRQDLLPASVESYLKASSIRQIHVVGGDAAVGAAVKGKLETLLR